MLLIMDGGTEMSPSLVVTGWSHLMQKLAAMRFGSVFRLLVCLSLHEITS